jgi:hypothetical protein
MPSTAPKIEAFSEPLTLDEPSAENFIGAPREFLKRKRKQDRHRVQAGLPRLGPNWIQLGPRCVRYEIEELRRWLRSKEFSTP